MSSFKQKQQKRKLVPGKLLKAALLIFIGIYFVCIIISQQTDLAKYRNIFSEYNQKIQEETLKNERLQDEYAQTSTDEYQERMAREKLGYVRANERVFIDVSNCE